MKANLEGKTPLNTVSVDRIDFLISLMSPLSAGCEYDVDLAYRAVVERITNLENANHLAGSIKLPKISSSCKEKSCPYRKFYEDSMEILTNKQESADRSDTRSGSHPFFR